MTQTQKTPHTLRVSLSDYHNGQIVYPVVTATTPHIANSQCHVDLYWYDRSDGGKIDPSGFDGTRDEAERWLLAKGVHLDAQGLH